MDMPEIFGGILKREVRNEKSFKNILNLSSWEFQLSSYSRLIHSSGKEVLGFYFPRKISLFLSSCYNFSWFVACMHDAAFQPWKKILNKLELQKCH